MSMSVREAAYKWGVSTQRIYQLLKDERLETSIGKNDELRIESEHKPMKRSPGRPSKQFLDANKEF